MFYPNKILKNTTKKVTAVFVTAVMLCGFSVSGTENYYKGNYVDKIPDLPKESDEDVSISIKLPVDDILIGDVIYIDITADNNAGAIRGYEFLLDYDADVLEYKETEFYYMGNSVGDNVISNVLQDTEASNGENRLCVFAAAVGENSFEDSDNTYNGDNGVLCRISFTGRKAASTDIKLASKKTVFEDMTYFTDTQSKVSVAVNITDPAEKETVNKRPGSSGSGGGVSFGGGVSSSGTSGSKNNSAGLSDDKNSDNKSSENTDESDMTYNGANSDTKPINSMFIDMNEAHWAYNAVKRIAELKIINGYEDGSFRPDELITRAEFSKILYSASNYDNGAFKRFDTVEVFGSCFGDVTEDDWFFEAVTALNSAGILKGSEGMFRPQENITRQDAAVMVKRFLDYTEIEVKVKREPMIFSDSDDIADYARTSIEFLYQTGIVSGADNSSFLPRDSMKRCEAAAVIQRIIELAEEI